MEVFVARVQILTT